MPLLVAVAALGTAAASHVAAEYPALAVLRHTMCSVAVLRHTMCSVAVKRGIIQQNVCMQMILTKLGAWMCSSLPHSV